MLTKLFEKIRALLNPPVADWDTVGPAEDEHPLVPVPMKLPEEAFTDGRWRFARMEPAHPGRVGGTITPQTLVVHTTDMLPGTFGSIVRSWTTKAGAGNGAHFLIGRTAEDGVVQFVPIHKNANHAGGKNPGGIKLSGTLALVHPNTCSVGVELDNAGRLERGTDGRWFHPDTWQAIPTQDVYVDEFGKGWHKITQYQADTLFKLWNDLQPFLKPWPKGAKPSPNDDYRKHGVSWASALGPELIGHVTLNPINKTDPGPEVMEMINEW